MSISRRMGILRDVEWELGKQDAKWGEQNHPDGTGPKARILSHTDVNLDLRTGEELANIFRDRCNNNFSHGEDNWRDILLEEVFEALAEGEAEELRKELIQSAAVCLQWVEAIDRRKS